MLVQSMPFPLNLAGGNVTFAGSYATGFTGDGGTVNFSNLRNSAGAAPTLAEGDLVIATVGRLNQSSFPMTASDLYPSGYTSIRTDFTSGTNAGGGLSYKVMGSTPDTSLAITNTGTGGSFGTASVSIIVLRGVDPSSPIDAAVAAASSASGPPNAPAVTPASTGAIVFAAGFSTTTNNSVVTDFTRPSNLDSSTNAYRSYRANVGGGSFQACTGAGFASWTSGAFDPDAFTGDANWGAGRGYTLSFRPYAAPVFGVTLNDTIPLSYTITGSPIGTASAWSWRKDGAEVSTTETGPTPDEDGAVYTLRLTMANGPYSASVTTTGLTYSEGNLLQSSGGDAILIQSGGDNILIREFE